MRCETNVALERFPTQSHFVHDLLMRIGKNPCRDIVLFVLIVFLFIFNSELLIYLIFYWSEPKIGHWIFCTKTFSHGHTAETKYMNIGQVKRKYKNTIN